MKKKSPTKKQKKTLVDLMDAFDWMFGLKNFERSLVYMEANNPESMDCSADITITEDYQRVQIRIYPNFWDATPFHRRMYLLHEMCHTLIQPIQREAKELRLGNLRTQEQVTFATEKVTSAVTILFDELIRGGRRWMRTAYKKYERSELSKPKKKIHMASKKPAAKPMKKAAAKKK